GSAGAGGAAGSAGAGGSAGGGGGGRAQYMNPVIPGDFPDPSIIRVGGDYWATATTSDWGAPFPILHSTDLVNWQRVGTTFSQKPAWARGYFWAPEISVDNGKYYMYYTGQKPSGPLCVAVATADSPLGPWADHGPLVCQDVGSIDGFPIRDENGTRYLLWKEDGNSVGQPTPIWAQPLSEDGLQLIGAPTKLFQNDPSWEANLVEGPFVMRHGGYFYALYSAAGCCGKGCSYAMGVARATSLLGPWQKNPANPIHSGNDVWKCPGHGSIVDDGAGRYYLLYHAYHAEDTVFVGRQGVLDEVVFGDDGWPSINGGQGPSVVADAPIAAQNPWPAEVVDEFTGAALDPTWQWPVATPPPQATIDASDGGRLVLKALPEGVDAHLGAVLGWPTLRGDYEVTVDLALGPQANAGVAAFGDGNNAVGLAIGGGQAVVFRLANATSEAKAQVESPDAVRVRMRASNGHFFQFSISADGGASWTPVGGVVDSELGPDLPPWDRGVRASIFAKGPDTSAATFASFRMTQPSY
ncbi:MAG TPA: family 43 glycosylhydrolase, partial [Polyangiaceae bacterium]|nr:family 43 glycosylhydrolase [Polyangiaceae bacterium]